jgi:hypothetical protein
LENSDKQREVGKPTIYNYPTEIFGHPFTDHSQAAKEGLKKQYCPYLKGTCNKPRKSEPHIKVGMCSVGYKGFLKKFKPIIICPQRFLENEVFESVKRIYLSKWNSIEWVHEVGMGVGGNVDFVAVNKEGDTIKDFLCVEFQAAGTTGTPWAAFLDFQKDRKYSKNTYAYGINWANEFMKTMMQQVYKKGNIIKNWGRKIVFVVQDVAIDYLHTAVDTSELRDFNDKDEIHFMTFKLVWVNDRWVLKFNNIVCTNLEGINKILGGAHKDDYPTAEEFKKSILLKGKRDGIFQSPAPSSF